MSSVEHSPLYRSGLQRRIRRNVERQRWVALGGAFGIVVLLGIGLGKQAVFSPWWDYVTRVDTATEASNLGHPTLIGQLDARQPLAPAPTAAPLPLGVEDWGARPDSGDWQAGLQVTESTDHEWQGHPVLRFDASDAVSTLSRQRLVPMQHLWASIFLVTDDPAGAPVRIGLIGFDETWNWTDDGFRWVVTPGIWTRVSWELPAPTNFQELGFDFPPGVRVAYVGDFEVAS